MATDKTVYLIYTDAVATHIELMLELGETRFGVAEPDLIKSALARPRHAAVYEKADIVRQAATLCYGLIKNHPWVGGYLEAMKRRGCVSFGERVNNK